MSKAIFNINAGLYRICTDSDWAAFQNEIIISDYHVIDISDDDFNNIKWETKIATSYAGDTINYTTSAPLDPTIPGADDSDPLMLAKRIESFKEVLNTYKESDATWKQTEVQDTINNIDAIDTSSVTDYPDNNQFFKWLNDKSITFISTLQLS